MAQRVHREEPALEEVKFHRRDELPFEVEVLRLEELLRRPLDHDLTKPQRIHFHAILLVEEGMSFHDVDFERYPTGPGHLLVVPAMHVQAFASQRLLQGYMAVFTPSFLDSCDLDMKQLADASRVLSSAGPLIRLDNDSLPRVRDAFQTLAEYTRLPPGRFANKAVAAAFSLLVFTLAGLPETAASAAAQEPQDALVERFLRQLEDHFASEHQAQYYAKALHVSLRSLDRHLVAARSQTTRQAIAARLVLEAKRLLTRREMLVKNIAYELGFLEPQNFTRFFRTQTGLSPKAFRQMLDS